MKRILIILTIALLLIRCSNNNPLKKQDESVNQIKQKQDSIAKHKSDNLKAVASTLYEISGSIKCKKTWCGGVQIKADDNTYKLKPYINKRILIIKGNVNSDTATIVKEIKTNAKGVFICELISGDYGLIIEEWKQVKFKLPTYNFESIGMIKCLKKEYKKPDIKLKVTNKAISNLSYTVVEYCPGGNICNPCGGAGRP